MERIKNRGAGLAPHRPMASGMVPTLLAGVSALDQ